MTKILMLTLGILFSLFANAGAGSGNQYAFMFLNSNPEKKVLADSVVQKHQKNHLANMERLAKENFLLVAGPFYKGGGIFVFRNEMEMVWDELTRDSAIMNDRFTLELLEIEDRFNGICPVGDEYKMVTYQFVRLFPFSGSQVLNEEPFNIDELKGIVHGDSLVYYGVFSNRKGAILIYRGPKNEKLPKLKSLENKSFGIEEKQLYIAEGSFCEIR